MKLILFLFLAVSTFAADVALTIGISKRTTLVDSPIFESKSSPSVILAPGGDIANLGLAAIGWEIPVAFGGPGRAVVSSGLTATEKLDFMLVPGARVRFVPVARLSPWASFGIGVGRVDQELFYRFSSGLTTATQTSFAFAVGVGADFKVAGPLFLRAEGRNFNYKGLEDIRRNSLQFLAGVGLRF
jgi:hypothetical protein